MKISLTAFFVIILVIGAFFLRVHGINYHSYGDEHYHVYNSLGLASGQLPGNFHRIALFTFYGVLYVLGWIGGLFSSPYDFMGTYFSQMHIFYYMGRFFESVAGAAGVLLLYLLGQKIFSRMTGLIAAIFLAVSPVAVEISQIARGQALCLFMIIASMYFICVAIESGRKNVLYFLSGLCFGAALSIRIYVFIILIPLAYFYIQERQTGGCFLSGDPSKPNRPRPLIRFQNVLFGIGLWVFIIAALLAYAVSAPQMFVNFHQYLRGHISNLVAGTAEGKLYLGADVADAFRYYLTTGLAQALSFPLYIFSALAMIIALLKYKRKNYLALVLCVILYLLVMGRGSIAAARYLFPIFPALFLITADVLVSESKRLKLPGRFQTAVCLGIAVILTIPALSMVNARNQRNRQQTTKDLAQEWIFRTFPGGTRIAVESMGYRGPDLKLTPVIDYWIYNLSDKELQGLLRERLEQGQPSFALKYFIQNPPSPRFYTSTLSVREVIDIQGLIDAGYQYIVTCSGNKAVYEREITRQRYPEHYAARVNFYRWLEEEGQLIKVFTPDESTPGDEIRVYQVSPAGS